MMKPIKNNLFLSFPFFMGKYLGLLFFIVFSVKGIAQLHISENTLITIRENTILHGADEIYDAKILTTEKETKSKKIAKHNNEAKKPLQPPIVKKDTEPEKKSVLSFVPKEKTPSALFYSGNTTKAALVQNTTSGTKYFPLKKSYNNIIPSFLLNGNQQINISSNEFLLTQQADLEGNITRPPPFQFS